MIGSFWNLCRACPAMPVDKQLHSEYRSTYRWHEFTGNSRPEVVRRAPAPNPSQFIGSTNEPPLPRRKKCPELAYKSHEFIIGSEYSDFQNNTGRSRVARSEERGTPSRRSKSEGPSIIPNGRTYPISTEVDGTSSKQAGESNGLFKKTISKLTTEYRLQFVWPNVRRIKGHTSNDEADHPKKSISMGAIRSKQQQQQKFQLQQQQHNQQHHQTMPTVHKKRTTFQKEAALHELEPLVSDGEDRKPQEKQVTIVERKITVRPFSNAFDQEKINHFITKKENFGFDENVNDVIDNKQNGVLLMNGSAPPHSQPNLDLWFKEVVELRKKAGEYKCRGWGIEIDPEMYKKQKDLWEQVSKRSSLSALSLASSVHRPYTKEEKEQENNKKSLPIKTQKTPRVPGQAYLIDNKDEIIALPARFSHIRHHLERTTGPDVEEGALLPSPTREKLMPAITKRESESQRGSPKKTAASRHGSPQKGSPQKGSPKKVVKSRSQSVGPAGIIENESPKRQLRSASTAPATKSALAGRKAPSSVHATPTPATATSAATTGTGLTTTTAERKPRPSTLSTTFHSRTKSSSLPPNGRTHSVPATNQLHSSTINQSQTTDTYNRKSPQTPQLRKKDKDRKNINTSSLSGGGKTPQSQLQSRPRPKTTSTTTKTTATIGSGKAGGVFNKNNADDDNSSPYYVVSGVDHSHQMTSSRLAVPSRDNKFVENNTDADARDAAISVSSCSPHPTADIAEEPLIKSPPEPTRVKSPEQIIMRSPDPVNWTVPLDTGKTFTVTQNVKEGENYSRPQSEIKASTPIEKPPPPPQSAPPELTEQVKMDVWKRSSSPNSAAGKLTAIHQTGVPGAVATTAAAAVRYGSKPVPGTTIRCLADPDFEDGGTNASSSSTSTTVNVAPNAARSTANEVLEKARDRFDRFWGANKEENV